MIDLYTAPAGSGNGLSSSTPASFTDVRALVRSYSGQDHITVHMVGGTYPLSTKITLDAGDGGNGYKILWRRKIGETLPVLSGGVAVTGWALYDAGNNIYKASVSPGTIARQLYVNGQLCTKPEWTGSLTPFSRTLSTYTGGVDTPVIYHSNADFPALARPQDLEFWFDGTLAPWSCCMCGVSSVDRDSGTGYTDFTMTDNAIAAQNSSVAENWPASWYYRPSRITGAYEFLDSTTKGGWYMNSDTGDIFYAPRDGEDMATAEVILPSLETVLDVDQDNPPSDLYFSGVGFQHSNWTYPTEDKILIDVQANHIPAYPYTYSDYFELPGMVELGQCIGVHFYQCDFSKAGCIGLKVYRGTKFYDVKGCEFYDIAGLPVAVDHLPGSMDPAFDDRISYGFLKSNYIHDYAHEYRGGVGTFVGYTDNTSLLENLYDGGNGGDYSAISFGYGWASGANAYCFDNEIGNNEFSNVMEKLTDGACIYTLGKQLNGKIYGNYGHDIRSGGSSANTKVNLLYTDEGSSYLELWNNVVLQTSSSIPNSFYMCNSAVNPNYMNVHDNYSAVSVYPYLATGSSGFSHVENATAISNDSGTWTQAVTDIVAAAGKRAGITGIVVGNSVLLFGWKNTGDTVTLTPTSGTITNYEDVSDTQWMALLQMATDTASVDVSTTTFGSTTLSIDITEVPASTNSLAAGVIDAGVDTITLASGTYGNPLFLRYRWDGGPWKIYTAPVTSQEGTFEWQAFDVNDNFETMQSRVYTGTNIKKLNGSNSGSIKKINGDASGPIKKLVSGSWQ